MSIYRCNQCGAEVNTKIPAEGILFMDIHFIDSDYNHYEFTVIYDPQGDRD